jgi:prevent-host-death family protein
MHLIFFNISQINLAVLYFNLSQFVKLQLSSLLLTNINIMIILYHNFSEVEMPQIRPISDLRNRANEISDLCHSQDEPVFITKNGKGDLVVMSQVYYERLQSLVELYQKLGESEALDASGEIGIAHQAMMRRLREKVK